VAERSSDAKRLVAGIGAAELAAVADSVGAAGRRVLNDTASIPPTCARKHRGT